MMCFTEVFPPGVRAFVSFSPNSAYSYLLIRSMPLAENSLLNWRSRGSWSEKTWKKHKNKIKGQNFPKSLSSQGLNPVNHLLVLLGSPDWTMLITNLNSFSRVLFWTFQKAETLKAGNFLISMKTLTAPPLLSWRIEMFSANGIDLIRRYE